MADKLTEVAKQLGQTKRNAEAALRRYAARHPRIDRVRDVFDDTIPFEMEFEVLPQDSAMALDLFFNKPPPLSSCDFGRYGLFCTEFVVGPGDHLLQVTKYIAGSVDVFREGVRLTRGVDFYEYDAQQGLVWVQNSGATNTLYTVCYESDTWADCNGIDMQFTTTTQTPTNNPSNVAVIQAGFPSVFLTNEFRGEFSTGTGTALFSWSGYAEDFTNYNDGFYQIRGTLHLDNTPASYSPNNFKMSYDLEFFYDGILGNSAGSESASVSTYFNIQGGGQFGIDVSLTKFFNISPDYVETSYLIQNGFANSQFSGPIDTNTLSGHYSLSLVNNFYELTTPFGVQSGPYPTISTGFNGAIFMNFITTIDRSFGYRNFYARITNFKAGCALKADGTVG